MSQSMTWLARALSILAVLVLASACSSDKDKAAAQVVCPSGVTPKESASVTRFRDGPGRDATDVVMEGEILGILVQCKRDKQSTVVDLQVGLQATRGPADRSKIADLEYWVAIVDADKNIVERVTSRVRFEFKDNLTQLRMRAEDLEPVIPASDPKKAGSYEIMVGLQLTPEELAWNRSQVQARKQQ
jgi:hypothetical protein